MDESLTPEEQKKQEEFEKFLEETKEKFDKFFGHLGYICFVFNKEKHRGQSVYFTNSEKDVLAIVEPYANAQNVAEARFKKEMLKKLRREK